MTRRTVLLGCLTALLSVPVASAADTPTTIKRVRTTHAQAIAHIRSSPIALGHNIKPNTITRLTCTPVLLRRGKAKSWKCTLAMNTAGNPPQHCTIKLKVWRFRIYTGKTLKDDTWADQHRSALVCA